MRVKFSKTGDLRFISHLDLVRLFQRAVRRADIPVAISKGFTPRLKISITRALKLGLASGLEEAVFHLEKEISPETFSKLMNEKLPEGVKIVDACAAS